MLKNIDEYMEKIKEQFGDEPVCCVCGHKLSSHVDEEDGWRCHSVATFDLYQCECWLRKDRVEDEGIDYYSAQKRMEEHKKEFKEGRG